MQNEINLIQQVVMESHVIKRNVCSKKQKKLEALNAGKLEVLKQCILENKMEIEQEMLI